MKNQKGFTLIELLVVIAIIGILASVVLASLNSARNKGADAAIKANLANMRAQAALYYDNNNAFSGSALSCTITSAGAASGCSAIFGSGVTNSLYTGMAQAASTAGATIYGYTNSVGDAWVAAVALKAGGYYCVDSAGSAKSPSSIATVSTTNPVCP